MLRHALAAIDAQTVTAHDVAGAMHALGHGIDLVVCTLLFDESRMLELAARVGRERPQLPFVCCRVMSDLPAHSLDAAFAAAGHLGAVATVDLPHTARGEALARAEEALCRAVRAHLHDARQASMS